MPVVKVGGRVRALETMTQWRTGRRDPIGMWSECADGSAKNACAGNFVPWCTEKRVFKIERENGAQKTRAPEIVCLGARKNAFFLKCVEKTHQPPSRSEQAAPSPGPPDGASVPHTPGPETYVDRLCGRGVWTCVDGLCGRVWTGNVDETRLSGFVCLGARKTREGTFVCLGVPKTRFEKFLKMKMRKTREPLSLALGLDAGPMGQRVRNAPRNPYQWRTGVAD